MSCLETLKFYDTHGKHGEKPAIKTILPFLKGASAPFFIFPVKEVIYMKSIISKAGRLALNLVILGAVSASTAFIASLAQSMTSKTVEAIISDFKAEEAPATDEVEQKNSNVFKIA